MPTFRDVFEAYGVDYDTTMARFMGNEAMYLQLLDMLFQDENMQKLGRRWRIETIRRRSRRLIRSRALWAIWG